MDAEVDAFLAEVRAELIRARQKLPGDRVMAIALMEEVGELAKAMLDEPAANVRKEAVQTAVMAARIVLDGDGSVRDWRWFKGLDPLIQTRRGQEPCTACGLSPLEVPDGFLSHHAFGCPYAP